MFSSGSQLLCLKSQGMFLILLYGFTTFTLCICSSDRLTHMNYRVCGLCRFSPEPEPL